MTASRRKREPGRSLKRVGSLRRLVEVQDEYIKELVNELNEVVGLAYAHGWRSKRFKSGQQLRAKIAALRKQATEKLTDDAERRSV